MMAVMRRPVPRAALSLLLFSGWMALLFWGFVFHGGVHLLLAAALSLFPWKAAGARTLPPGPSPFPSPPPSQREGRQEAKSKD
jgi:hypothetical protein